MHNYYLHLVLYTVLLFTFVPINRNLTEKIHIKNRGIPKRKFCEKKEENRRKLCYQYNFRLFIDFFTLYLIAEF